MTITLPPDLEQALASRATQAGKEPDEFLLDMLRSQLLPGDDVPRATAEQTSLADYLAGYIGAVSTSERHPGGAQMSQRTSKEFAAGLKKKRAEGHL